MFLGFCVALQCVVAATHFYLNVGPPRSLEQRESCRSALLALVAGVF